MQYYAGGDPEKQRRLAQQVVGGFGRYVKDQVDLLKRNVHDFTHPGLNLPRTLFPGHLGPEHLAALTDQNVYPLGGSPGGGGPMISPMFLRSFKSKSLEPHIEFNKLYSVDEADPEKIAQMSFTRRGDTPDLYNVNVMHSSDPIQGAKIMRALQQLIQSQNPGKEGKIAFIAAHPITKALKKKYQGAGGYVRVPAAANRPAPKLTAVDWREELELSNRALKAPQVGEYHANLSPAERARASRRTRQPINEQQTPPPAEDIVPTRPYRTISDQYIPRELAQRREYVIDIRQPGNPINWTVASQRTGVDERSLRLWANEANVTLQEAFQRGNVDELHAVNRSLERQFYQPGVSVDTRRAYQEILQRIRMSLLPQYRQNWPPITFFPTRAATTPK